MSTASRTFSKAIPRAAASSLRSCSRTQAPRQFLQSTHRQYSSQIPRVKSNATRLLLGATFAVTAFGGGWYLSQVKPPDSNAPEFHIKQGSADQAAGLFKPTAADYQEVYNAIAKLLWDNDDYDDGSYGPVVLRLAWHASGTYDAKTQTGGSNGATMRFAPEGNHGANNGLKNARDFLEPVKQQFPWISYSDLWTLAGVCAIQEMQGPAIPWRPGRQDRDASYCTPDGRLPDGAKGQDHIRNIFGRMGFNDQEMVALSGAHALGRCHQDRSGFEGPWTFSPTVVTNEYFRLLMDEKWGWKNWDGQRQYEDATTKSLMMLPTDMALIKDPEFLKTVTLYAKDNDRFFEDFSNAVVKLLELGVPFNSTEEDRLRLKTYDEQGLEYAE